jgi:hypothetical protein
MWSAISYICRDDRKPDICFSRKLLAYGNPPRLDALEGQTPSVASLRVGQFFEKEVLFVSRFVEWFSFADFIGFSTSHVPAKSNAYLENAGSMYKSLVTTLNAPETASLTEI